MYRSPRGIAFKSYWLMANYVKGIHKLELAMTKIKPTSLIFEHFETIQDPRVNRRKKYRLQDILFMTLSVVICGADNWVAVEEFCKTKEKWLTKELKLEHGIPSHDTFGNVFSMLDTQHFSECFTHWMNDISMLTEGEVIAVDGKCLRGTKSGKKSALYMVSAWACQNQCVLEQQVVIEQPANVPKLSKAW